MQKYIITKFLFFNNFYLNLYMTQTPCYKWNIMSNKLPMFVILACCYLKDIFNHTYHLAYGVHQTHPDPIPDPNQINP